MGEENHAEWVEAVTNPETVRAMLEDYRAGLGIDAEHERADRAAGRRVSARCCCCGRCTTTSTSMATRWRSGDPGAPTSAAGTIDSGHHMAEENPAALVAALVEFLRRLTTSTITA